MPEDPTPLLTAGAERARAFAQSHAGTFVSGSLASLGTLAATLFALFFMLRDGDAMSRQIRELLPFPREESERLMSDTSDLVIASVRAGIVLAIGEGVIAGIAFWLLGLGPPVTPTRSTARPPRAQAVLQQSVWLHTRFLALPWLR